MGLKPQIVNPITTIQYYVHLTFRFDIYPPYTASQKYQTSNICKKGRGGGACVFWKAVLEWVYIATPVLVVRNRPPSFPCLLDKQKEDDDDEEG